MNKSIITYISFILLAPLIFMGSAIFVMFNISEVKTINFFIITYYLVFGIYTSLIVLLGQSIIEDIVVSLMLLACSYFVGFHFKNHGYEIYIIPLIAVIYGISFNNINQYIQRKVAQQGDAPEPDSRRSCLMDTTSRPGDL